MGSKTQQSPESIIIAQENAVMMEENIRKQLSKFEKEVLTLSAISRYMVLRGESTPAVIPDQQMLRFKFMLDYSDETISMSTSPLAPGEKVRVIKGPLAGLEGELVNVDGKSKVAVRLTMLGCACVDIPVGCVEPVSENGDLRD